MFFLTQRKRVASLCLAWIQSPIWIYAFAGLVNMLRTFSRPLGGMPLDIAGDFSQATLKLSFEFRIYLKQRDIGGFISDFYIQK